MKKKILGVLFVAVASVVPFIALLFFKEGLEPEIIIFVIFIAPFAWLATVIYCKYFAPQVQKRVAMLTMLSILFITTFLFTFIQKEVEHRKYWEQHNVCMSNCYQDSYGTLD